MMSSSAVLKTCFKLCFNSKVAPNSRVVKNIESRQNLFHTTTEFDHKHRPHNLVLIGKNTLVLKTRHLQGGSRFPHQPQPIFFFFCEELRHLVQTKMTIHCKQTNWRHFINEKNQTFLFFLYAIIISKETEFEMIQ